MLDQAVIIFIVFRENLVCRSRKLRLSYQLYQQSIDLIVISYLTEDGRGRVRRQRRLLRPSRAHSGEEEAGGESAGAAGGA